MQELSAFLIQVLWVLGGILLFLSLTYFRRVDRSFADII